MPNSSNAAHESSNPQWFATTHWSVVLSAGQAGSPRGPEALDKLCRTYWPPLYGYIRRRGHGPEEAKDLTQAFFARQLEKNFWARANPEKGRFRSFLLNALRNFLADEYDKTATTKRGGGYEFISFDAQSCEEQALQDTAPHLSGEQQFERRWAATVLGEAQARLHEECVASGKAVLWDRVSLIDDKGDAAVPYEAVAQEMGLTVGAVKSAVSRLRQRYGELVRDEVAKTVSSPGELEAEIRHLLTVIGWAY